MSNHWFEMRGCPSCGHVWHIHLVEDFGLMMPRLVRPYVIKETHVCPECKHEFIYPKIESRALPGHDYVELTDDELKNGYIMGGFRIGAWFSASEQTKQEPQND